MAGVNHWFCVDFMTLHDTNGSVTGGVCISVVLPVVLGKPPKNGKIQDLVLNRGPPPTPIQESFFRTLDPRVNPKS